MQKLFQGVNGVEFSNCINYLLTVAQHEVCVLFSERLSPFGLTPGQYGVLNYLWGHGSASPKEIAKALQLESSTISGVLDRMQKRDFIDRVLDPSDRRSIRVEVTKEGMAIKDKVLETISTLNSQVTSDITLEEKETLFALLKKIGRIDAQ